MGYSIQDFLIDLIDLFNFTIIPALIALAIFFIIWNAFRYFIWSGDTEEGRDSAKRLAIYGVAALVAILSMWGIIRLTIYTLGINISTAPCPDYNPDCFTTGQGGGAPIGNGGNGPLLNGQSGGNFFTN